MGRHAIYTRRFNNAPGPETTDAESERQNCIDFIDDTIARCEGEWDGDAYLDSDPRPLFQMSATELHGNRLEIVASHSELPEFTLRWPDADIQFVEVREPLPDDYYDNHDRVSLNYYTVFIMDFAPYGDVNHDEKSSPSAEYDIVTPLYEKHIRTTRTENGHVFGA